jgi:hypothetical protein
MGLALSLGQMAQAELGENTQDMTTHATVEQQNLPAV